MSKYNRTNVHDRREETFPADYEPKYFSRTEFELCSPSCILEDMDPDFLKRLDLLRECCGFPLSLNCAFRSVEHEKANGRSGSSFHCAGRAADIRCVSNSQRFTIVQNAMFLGLSGIGIYDTFIHVDDRETPCLWYGSKSGSRLASEDLQNI